MKILKVKSLNINSLKGSFEIDFEAFLQDESLFAITGSTGSGKSTILDIITCALYGKTPRLSNPNELMSRHTSESLCEVEFEIKAQRYRSSWSQKRARKKADGKFQTAKMEVAEVASGKIIKSKLREVPKYIEKLSGLDFDRFIQSMMLAQGSFDAFLKAKENERSNLLEKITGTSIYKEISKEVYDIFGKKKEAIENDTLAIGHIELFEKKFLEEKRQELEVHKLEKQELDKKEEELKIVASWLENLQTLHADNIRYSQKLEQISYEKEDKKEDFHKLELSQKALRVQPIYQEKKRVEITLNEDKNRLQVLNNEQITLQETVKKSTVKFNTVTELLAKENLAFERNSIKLKILRDIQSQIKSKTDQKQELQNKGLKLKQDLATLFGINTDSLDADSGWIHHNVEKENQAVETLKRDLDALTIKYQQIEEKYLTLIRQEDKIRLKIRAKEKLLESVDTHNKLLETILLEKQSQQEYTDKKISINAIYNQKAKLIKQINQTLHILKEKREIEQLIKNYEEDRVKLKEGEACFLCGAVEHPYLNQELEVYSNETTQKIKEEEEHLLAENDELNACKIELVKVDSKLEASTLAIEQCTIQKDEIEVSFSTSNFIKEANSKEKLSVEIEQQEKELDQIVRLRAQQERVAQEKENLQIQYNLAEQLQLKIKSFMTLNDELQYEEKKINDAIEKLKNKSKNILDIDDIDSFESSITERLNTLQEEYNSLQNTLSILHSKDESLQKQIEEFHIKQKNDSQKLLLLEKEFQTLLEENDFTSKEEFEKNLIVQKEYEKLNQLCKNIEEQYTSIKILKTETTHRLKKQKELNLTSRTVKEINEELERLQTSIDRLQKSIGRLEIQLEIDANNRQKYKEKIGHIDKKKESFRVWIKLNEMIGSRQGDKFSKFAQGITLDQLIYLANKYLKKLSPRYELQRALDSSKLLEIEIIDGFQGDVVRPVSTLSGGESFIVSLSLALGLSTLASQKISIDSLFLDEGFGTLDSNGLELALNALNQLQNSGKMVGVISHVEALKERIPLQIRVEPKGDGTSVVTLVK